LGRFSIIATTREAEQIETKDVCRRHGPRPPACGAG
jgi:hypothetical protein